MESNWIKVNELLSKFKDGESRYKTEPLFQRVIDSLLHGADPIGLIDQLLIIDKQVNDEYIKHISVCPMRVVVAEPPKPEGGE
jgi:hypothetical protein